MVVRKRQIIAAALVLALGSAVFINWYYNRPSVKSANAKSGQTLLQHIVSTLFLGPNRTCCGSCMRWLERRPRADVKQWSETASTALKWR